MIYIFIIFILLILILITKYFVDKKLKHYKEHQSNPVETSTTVAATATVLYEGEDLTYECPTTDHAIHGSDSSSLNLPISNNPKTSGLSIQNDKIKVAMLIDGHSDPEKLQCKCKPPAVYNSTTGECDYPIKWKVGMKGESCTAVCNNPGETCDQGISQLQNIDSADKLRSVVMKIHAYDATDNNFFCGGNGTQNSDNLGWLGPQSNNNLVPHNSIMASQCLPPDGSTSADCGVANAGVKRLCCCPSANDPLDKVCPIGSNSIAEWESAGVPKCASDFSWGSNKCSQTFEQKYFPALSMQKINEILAPDGLILSASEGSKDDDINNTTPLSMSTSGGNSVPVINTLSNLTTFNTHLKALIKQVGRVLLVVKVRPHPSNLMNIPTGFETKEFTLMLYMDNPPADKTSGSMHPPKYHFGSYLSGIASGPPNWDHIVTSHEARFNGDNRATFRMHPNGTSGFHSAWGGAHDTNVYSWIRSSVKRGGHDDNTVFSNDDFNTRYVIRNEQSMGYAGTTDYFFVFGAGHDFSPGLNGALAYSNVYSYVKEGSTSVQGTAAGAAGVVDSSFNGVGKNIQLDILSMSLYGVKLGGPQEHIKALMYQRGVINYALHKDNYILDPNPQMSKMWVNTGSSNDNQFTDLKSWFKNTLLTKCQKTVMVMTVKIRQGTHKGKEFTWMAFCKNWPTTYIQTYGSQSDYPTFIRSSIGSGWSNDNFNTKIQTITGNNKNYAIYDNDSEHNYIYTLGAHNFYIQSSGRISLASTSTGPGAGQNSWIGGGEDTLVGNINEANSTAHMVRMSIYGVQDYSLGKGAQNVFYLNNILAKDNLILGLSRTKSSFSTTNLWITGHGGGSVPHHSLGGLKSYLYNNILPYYNKSICFITLKTQRGGSAPDKEFSLMLYCSNWPDKNVGNVGGQTVTSRASGGGGVRTWIRSSIGSGWSNDAFKTKYIPEIYPAGAYYVYPDYSQSYLYTFGGGHDVMMYGSATSTGTISLAPHTYIKEGGLASDAKSESRAFNGTGTHTYNGDGSTLVNTLLRVEVYGVLNKDGSL